MIRHLPGQSGAGDEDVAHAGRILDDPSAPYIDFGAMTRRADKLAAAEGTPPHATRIRLYHVGGLGPLGTPPSVTYRCELTGARYESVSWAPDGSALAYEAAGSIYVVRVGDLSSGCPLGTPVRVAAGHTPSWGPAGLPGAPRLRVAVPSTTCGGRSAHGLRLRVDGPGSRARHRAGEHRGRARRPRRRHTARAPARSCCACGSVRRRAGARASRSPSA